MNKLEESHEAYQEQRARDKYEGKVEKTFPVKEFRKSTDYLAGLLEKVDFNAEDVGDMVRVALSRRVKVAAAQEQGSEAK